MPFENLTPNLTGESARLPESFHSRYDPLKEATRHVESCLEGKRPSLVFILGGGYNYVGAVIRRDFPNTRMVVLQPSDIFDQLEICQPSYRWSPSSNASLEDVLHASLQGEYISGGISIIEWNPVMQAFREKGEYIRQSLRIALELASSQSATASFWAYRWLRNCVRYAMNANVQTEMTLGTTPIVVSCAGPGLSGFYSKLRKTRGRFSLWCLASASLALRAHGLEPDLVIATDPGFWNAYHLHDSVGKPIPIALPPSAYAPHAVLEYGAMLPLDTGLTFERIALKAIGAKSISADSSGSSAGTALSLALSATKGQVFLLGLDLAARGNDDHSRPYAFDIFDTIASTRSAPEYSLRSARILDTFAESLPPWRTSRPFSAYAKTIKVHASHSGRVFRCSDSPVVIGIPSSELNIGSNTAPPGDAIRFVTTQLSIDTKTRITKLIEGFSAAIEAASAEARLAIETRRPMHHTAALLYRALAGKQAAETIANTARACAKPQSIDVLDQIAIKKLLEVVSR
jgi:hypothetical protein